MANGKKSVLLYCDLIHTVKPLTDEEAGKLFKHYLSYINDLNPEPIDRLTGLLFEPIKQNLKRDLVKWESKSLKNSENAKLRWDKKDANACERIKSDANYADTVTDTVKDTVTVKVKENNIEERKQKFASTLKPFINIYGKEMLMDFYRYWTEPNKSNTKFKYENEKTWSLDRRLETWSNNESKFKPKQKPTMRTTNEVFDEISRKIKSGEIDTTIYPIL